MKKLLTILILLLAVASQSWADGESTSLIGGFSIWSGGDTYTQVESSSSYKFTTKQNWGGMGNWISSGNPSGKRLVVKTEEDADLNITVGYTNGISFERMLSSKDRYIKLNDQYSIQNVNIQYAVDASSTEGGLSVIFTDISIDNSSEDSPVEVVKLNLLNAMTPDDNTTYTNSGDNKKMETSASWKGISISNNLQASTIYVKATDVDNKDSKLKIAAYYSDGWSTEYFDQVVSGGKTLKFDKTRTITYLQIQNQENATTEDKKSITFSDIYIDTPTETLTYAESFQIRINISSMASEGIATYSNDELTINASKTASLDLSGITSLRQGKNLVVNFAPAAKANITVTYSDASSYVYNAGESGATSRTLKLEDKEISKIEIENAETSASAVVTSLYLNEADNSSSEEGSTSVDYGTELTTTSTLPVATENYANYAQYDKTLFSDAKVGDIITASISDVDAGDEIALQSDWKNLNAAAGATLGAGASSWQYTLTASGINQLKDNGLIVKGKNITINKVYLKSVGSESPDISEVALANFDDINMESKEGKQLYAGSSSNISAQNKKLVVTLSAAAKLKVAVYLVDVDNPITEEVTAVGTAKSEYSVSLGSEDRKIKKILITNNGTDAVTYSSISLEDYVDPNLIWSGSQELTSTALDIVADKFNNVESGNRIRLTIGSISGGENVDKTMKVTYTKDANTYETFNGSVKASETYDFEITPTNIEAIKANGISITGSNATLTKIERITDGYSEGTPSLDDLPAGWSAVYNSTDKVITFSDGWQAKGWNIGTATYNEKKDFVVTFTEKPVKTGTTEDAVNVMLYVDYVNQYGKTETLSNSTSTDLSVSIPLKENEQITNGIVRIINILIKTDVATTLELSDVAFNEYVPRTSKDLSTGSQKIRAHSSVAIAKGMFVNAAVGDVLTINVSDIAEGAKYSLKGHGEDDSGSNWSSFVYDAALTTDATPITRILTSEDLAIIKDAGLSIEGNGFTCGNVTLSTAGVVGTAQTHTNPTFALTVNATGGNVAVYQEDGTTLAADGPYEIETNLVLKAMPNDNFVFVKWTEGTTDLAANEDKSLSITMDNNREITAVFSTNPLENEERRTLWVSGNADGDALNWEWSTGAAMMPSAISDILEVGEQLIFTVKVTGDSPSIRVDKLAGGEVANTGLSLVDGENRLSLTAAMITEMADGFKLNGQGASITKLELYKPTPITALAEEDTKTLWSNTSGEALAEWNTITIDRNSEWGAVLEEDERIIISVKAKDANCEWPTVALSNSDGSINSTSNLLNDLTMPAELTITLTAEMVNKMKNGFNITGDGATITKAVLYKPTMPAKTVHTLNSTETAISGDANVTVAAAKFANISAYDVLTVNFTITTSPANVILKGNGEDGGWDYLKEMKFENGETLFALPLTPAMTSNLKKNGLQITGSDYKCKSVTIKTAGEVPSDGEDDISNDASEEAKKVYNVLKDLYGKKIVSGVVANVDWNTKEAENVYGWTGKYPAMNVYDYINLHASKDVNSAGWVDYSDITTAKNWWKEGGIVGAMWHWQVKANNGTDYTCTPGTAAGETSFDASKVYVEGTSENTLAKQQLDQLCGYLKKMQDAGIPVVWRPLHEASGNVEQYSGGKAWFWWGAKGADVYKQLWQWMYNYMVKTKGLNNLIWVWTSQTKDNNWYPGDAYVDIIGRDNYGATAATLATEYETQKAAYPNKMITLSECGNSETTEMAKLSSIWDAGSRWSWFMTWYDGDYNKGASTTHKHAGETWWKDAVSKDYVVTRDQMKELLGQESSDDSKTGVNISLDDLNEGWSSSYNATTKTITTEGEWAARGWYIGDNRYNSKGSVTVKFEAVNFGVTLKMEYTNTGGESKSVSAGAAAGETGVELDIPADIKTMDKVYITYQPIGTLKLTAATVNDKVVDNRTERTLVEKSQAISDGDIAINRGLFSNAVAGDVLRIYADGLSESSKLALEPGDYSGAFDAANWTGFTESPFKLKLTATLIATIKEKGLLIRGESFTFKKAVLYTEKELGSEISDEEKKGDEEKDDEEAIIDEKTGEADLTVLSAQDDTKTTLTQNEDGSITMTTTEPYCAAQIWFNDPEPVAGNVLKVELAESKVNVTITVQYTDGTQSQMSANTSGVATARAATRGDSDPGTTIEVPLETGKEVQNIEVKNNVAGTITIKKMQVTTINIFTNGVANLSMLKPQSNATYDTSTHTLATTKGWTGATISPVGGENVSGKELLIEFADASKVKVAVKYRTDVEGPSTIMEKAAKAVRLALDNTKNIQEISIQPTEASIVTFKKIAVNSEESDDGTLKPGKTITLWESAAGETLSWNEVAKQDASVGEMLQEYDELLITISGVTEGCDWPKVFIRDASSEQAGNEVLLNDVGSFPYTVRIVLTGEMAQQLQKGFSICGDGVTVTKLQVYRPEAPKTGDIHLSDLNYGYNSSYDKGTHTITTTARWAARGWEIGDKRYNDKNLITVKFEPVDFPVTLKMEYTTGLQTAQATSVGVPAGRTELLLEIPSGISKLDRVYIIYENPGSVKLTEASVTYQDKLKLSTAIEAFEAEGVIHDGRYDTDGWYNLRGMRIAEPKTSGIYIHGGKKVVIY